MIVVTLLLAGCLRGKQQEPYLISGRVVENRYLDEQFEPDESDDAENNRLVGIEGVNILLSSNSRLDQECVTTDSEGKWEAIVRGEVTVTASLPDYNFNPQQRKVSKPDSNVYFVRHIEGNEPPYMFTGRVIDYDTGEGVAGVKVSYLSKPTFEPHVLTDSEGYFEMVVPGSAEVTFLHDGITHRCFKPDKLSVNEEILALDVVSLQGKMVGKVVIEGEPVNQTVQVRLRNAAGEKGYIKTDSNGVYEIDIDKVEASLGTHVEISVNTMNNLEQEYIDRHGLVSWSYLNRFRMFPYFLPDLELSAQGLKLIKPKKDEKITGYPYQVQISEYETDAKVSYRLYFANSDMNTIFSERGRSTESSFEFDGTLTNCEILTEDADWFISATIEGSYPYRRVNTFGTRVNYGGADESMAGFSTETESMVKSLPEPDEI